MENLEQTREGLHVPFTEQRVVPKPLSVIDTFCNGEKDFNPFSIIFSTISLLPGDLPSWRWQDWQDLGGLRQYWNWRPCWRTYLTPIYWVQVPMCCQHQQYWGAAWVSPVQSGQCCPVLHTAASSWLQQPHHRALLRLPAKMVALQGVETPFAQDAGPEQNTKMERNS